MFAGLRNPNQVLEFVEGEIWETTFARLKVIDDSFCNKWIP